MPSEMRARSLNSILNSITHVSGIACEWERMMAERRAVGVGGLVLPAETASTAGGWLLEVSERASPDDLEPVFVVDSRPVVRAILSFSGAA
jgi:hypothetical protein